MNSNQKLPHADNLGASYAERPLEQLPAVRKKTARILLVALKHDSLPDCYELAYGTGYDRKTVALGVSKVNADRIVLAFKTLELITRSDSFAGGTSVKELQRIARTALDGGVS